MKHPACLPFLFAALVLAAMTLPVTPAAAQDDPLVIDPPEAERLDLWPGDPPGRPVYDGEVPETHRPDSRHLVFVHKPTLTVYHAAGEDKTGAAVVVCPGGGYRVLADDHEGVQVAQWLQRNGITAIVLRYRMFPYRNPVPMYDVQRALRTVRANSEKWGLDPERIGVLGFSAGGHLASTAATHFAIGHDEAEDPVERVSSRPDFAVLVYPVISMRQGVTHGGSRNNLLGPEPDEALVAMMSNDEQVNKNTPPTLLVHSVDDNAVPIENSKRFYAAMQEHGVPGKLLTYQQGGHGYGLGREGIDAAAWPAACIEWFKEIGVTGRDGGE